MERQFPDFLQTLDARFVRNPNNMKRKSLLQSYFDSHHEFQGQYREPSSSPDVPDSSSLSPLIPLLYPEKARLPITHGHRDTTTNEPDNECISTGELPSPGFKKRHRPSTEKINPNTIWLISKTPSTEAVVNMFPWRRNRPSAFAYATSK
ncbi:unnamed protein product [Penicillium bialowiezense]